MKIDVELSLSKSPLKPHLTIAVHLHATQGGYAHTSDPYMQVGMHIFFLDILRRNICAMQ